MGYLDDIDPHHDGYQRRAYAEERERRYGVTEDDDKRIAPYIGIEDGSPLNFGVWGQRSALSYFAANAARWERDGNECC